MSPEVNHASLVTEDTGIDTNHLSRREKDKYPAGHDRRVKFTCNHLVKKANEETLRPERCSKQKAADFCFAETSLCVASNSKEMGPLSEGKNIGLPVKADRTGLDAARSTEACTTGLATARSTEACTTGLVTVRSTEACTTGLATARSTEACTTGLVTARSVEACTTGLVTARSQDHREGGSQDHREGGSHLTTVTQNIDHNQDNAVLHTNIPVENQMLNVGPTAGEHNCPLSNKECFSSEEEVKAAGEQTTQTEWECAECLAAGPGTVGEEGERTGGHCSYVSDGSILGPITDCPFLKNEMLWDVGGIRSRVGAAADIPSTVTESVADSAMLVAQLSEMPSTPPYQSHTLQVYQAECISPTLKAETRFEKVTSQHLDHDTEECLVEFFTCESGSQDRFLSGDLESGNSMVAPTTDLLLCPDTCADAPSQCPGNEVEDGPMVLFSSPTEVWTDVALEETVHSMMKALIKNPHMAAKITKILPQVPVLFQQWLLNIEDVQQNLVGDVQQNLVGDVQQNLVEDLQQKLVEDVRQNLAEDVQQNLVKDVPRVSINQGPLCDVKGPLCDGCHDPDSLQMTDKLVVKGLADRMEAPSGLSRHGSPVPDTMDHSATWQVQRINSAKNKDPSVTFLHSSELLFHVPTMEKKSKTKYSQNLSEAIGGVWQKSLRDTRNGDREVARRTLISTASVELELLELVAVDDAENQKHQRHLKTKDNCDETVSLDSASKTKLLSEGRETKLKWHRFQMMTSKPVSRRSQRAKGGIEMLVYEIQEMVIPRPLCEKHLTECQRAVGIAASGSKLNNWHLKEDPLGFMDSCEEANLLAGIAAAARGQAPTQLELTVQPIAEVRVQETQTSRMPGCAKHHRGRKVRSPARRRNPSSCSLS